MHNGALGVCVKMILNDLLQAHGTEFLSPHSLPRPHATLWSYIKEHLTKYLFDPHGIRRIVKTHYVLDGLPV